MRTKWTPHVSVGWNSSRSTVGCPRRPGDVCVCVCVSLCESTAVWKFRGNLLITGRPMLFWPASYYLRGRGAAADTEAEQFRSTSGQITCQVTLSVTSGGGLAFHSDTSPR